MALIASNIVFAPPPAEPEVKQRIVVNGGDWRNQIFNQLEEVQPERVSVEVVEPPAPKSKKTRKKSEELIEYKESSFMADMLSDHKE